MGRKLTFFNQKNFFLRKEDGATLIEFAILAPTFILLMLGILNIGLMMVIQNALEAAVREASRYGVTGASQTGMTRGASITAVIRNVCDQYSGGIIDSGKLTISFSAYPDLINVNSGTGQSNSVGAAGQAVLYKLSYPWDTFFSLFGESNMITLRAQTPVVNENF